MSEWQSPSRATARGAVEAGSTVDFKGSPPTVVQAVCGTSGERGLTLATAPTAGNLLVAMTFNPAIHVAGAGWTYIFEDGGGLDYGCLFTKVAGEGESSTQYPLTSAPGTGAMVIWEISGQNALPLVAYVSQMEQSGSRALGPQLPQIVDILSLTGVGTTENIVSSFNNIQDVVSNTGTRKVYGGHAFAPGTAQYVGILAVPGYYKSITCLIRAV